MDQTLCDDAITNEFRYVNEKVWKVTALKAATLDLNGNCIGSRCVKCNEGGAAQPKIRMGWVATGVDTHEDHSLYVATPPLEATMSLFALFVK